VITRAYLVGPSPYDLHQNVAGLSILLRALLSLQDAGIKEVLLYNFPQEKLPTDPRLLLSIHTTTNEELCPSLIVPAGAVWHPHLIQRLVKNLPLPDESNCVVSQNVAVYTAGEKSVEQTLQTLSDPEKVPTGEAPLDHEFLLSPSSEEERKLAEDLLFGTLIKPSDGFISRKINRPVSLRVTRAFINTSLTPNQMTLIAAAFGALGIALAFQGSFWALVFGALFYHTQSVLDGCDGEIARLKYLKSRFGEWLDQVLDDIVNISFLVAVGCTLSIQGTPYAWPITIATLSLHTLYQGSLYLAFWKVAGGRASVGALRWWGQGDQPTSTEPTSWFGAIKWFFENAGKRDFFTLAYLPCALFGIIEVAFVWHAFIASLSGVITTAQWVISGGPEAND
jgi:phosphatidylglycerophosphate synthase